MSAGPNLTRAHDAWGSALPDWVHELAIACDDRESQGAVADLVGYSASVINAVLGNSYAGNMRRVEASVRGTLMGTVVQCPVLGEMPRDRCRENQTKPFVPTSEFAARLWRACRAGCPNSLVPAKERL